MPEQMGNSAVYISDNYTDYYLEPKVTQCSDHFSDTGFQNLYPDISDCTGRYVRIRRIGGWSIPV